MGPHFFASISWIAMIVVLAVPAVSQLSTAEGSWIGAIKCELNIQVQGYSRHEIQTWTLTGEPPKAAGGTGVLMYPATWNYTGQGAMQRVDGTRATVAQWAVNIIPGEAPISFSIRNGVLLIKRASAQQNRYTGFTGQRQIAINGVPQLPIPLTAITLWEWGLPWIEAAPGDNVSGTITVRTEPSSGEIQQPGPPPPATCTYQFSKAGQEKGQNMKRQLPGKSAPSPANTIQEEQSLTNARVTTDQ